MPSNDPQSRRGSWRDQGGEAAAPTSGKRGWQQTSAPAAAQKAGPWSKQRKLTIAGVLLVVFLGGLAALILLALPFKPASLLVAGSGYETNLLLPPNVLGWQGLANIKGWADDSKTKRPWGIFETATLMRPLQPQEPPVQLHAPSDWKKLVATVRDKLRDKTLVLFLSLHGGADDKGPYLLTNDERGHGKLYLEEIFADLTDSSLSGRTIVLVLDAPHVEAHSVLGLQSLNFVEQLKKQYAKSAGAASNLFVLCACGPDQLSWASEEWQSSMFAHFFLKGLRGEADADGNLRVTLAELSGYLDAKVDEWARINRDRNQKPLLLGDARRAETINLVQTETAAAARTDPPAASWAGLSPSLKEKWKNWDALRRNKSPWTFAPHEWRRYQEALMRWEHLERCLARPGAGPQLDEKTAPIKAIIEDFERRIDDLRMVPDVEACLGNSIPLATALGYVPKQRKAIERQYDDLKVIWALGKVPDGKAQDGKAFEEAVARIKKDARTNTALLADLARLVLRDVLSKESLTPDVVDDAVIFWKTLEASLSLDVPRPIEVHYLLMVQNDRLGQTHKNAAPLDKVRLALEVRRLAEETLLGAGAAGESYSYTEFISPWIARDIMDADQERRLGEDLLFGTLAENWQKAEASLTAAKQKYEKIQGDAELLRQGFDVRDRATDTLRYYAQWLAQRNEEVQGRGANEALFLNLANDLAVLTRLLEKSEELKADLTKIVEKTKAVRKQHDSLKKQYDDAALELARQEKVQHRHYEDLETALRVPLLDLDKRERFIEQSRTITQTLLVGKQFVNVGQPMDAALAQRQRRLVAAALQLPDSDKLTDEVLELPTRIENGWRAAWTAKDETAAIAALIRPAQLSRIIPGGLAKFVPAVPHTPPESLRRLRVHDLLMALAKRTVADHWFEEDGKSAYYKAAGAAYVASATRLLGAPQENKKEEVLMLNLRKKASAFYKDNLDPDSKNELQAVTGGFNTDWTTERQFNLKWRIDPVGDVPAGIPMVWQTTASDPKGKAVPRKALEEMAKQMATHLETQNVSEDAWPSATDRELPVSFHALYRGQQLSPTVTLKKHDPNRVVHRYPPQANPRFAVRADEFDFRAVSIVLDNSGSMSYEYPTRKVNGDYKIGDKGNRRFDKALAALGAFLPTVPEGRPVSVTRFGKLGDDNNGVDFARPRQSWKANTQKDGLLSQLGDSELNFFSPIAKAIKVSLDEPLLDDDGGPRLVLVLTDGIDNWSVVKKEDRYRLNKDADREELFEESAPLVKRFLQQSLAPFYGRVKVVVVCFIDPLDPEYKYLDKQYKGIDNLILIKEKSGEALGARIIEALRPKLSLSEAANSPFELTPGNSELDWLPLDGPANHAAEITPYKTDIDRLRVDVKKGENLFMVLKNAAGGKTRLERGIVGLQREFKEVVPGKDVADWRLTLAAQKHRDGDTLDQLLLVENKKPLESLAAAGANIQDGAKIRPRMPGLVWLEAQADKQKTLGGKVRWYNDWSAPAPAFRLLGENWPIVSGDRAAPVLNVWCWRDDDFPGESDWCKRRSEDALLKEKKLSVGFSRDVFVEDIARETDQSIMEPSGKLRREECLVFRIKHTPGRPILIRPVPSRQNLSAMMGEEHLYFDDVGRYTAKFYLDLGNRGDLLFDLVCIESFKEAALKGTLTNARWGSELPNHFKPETRR